MSHPPVDIPLGAMRFNSESLKLEYFDGLNWLQVNYKPMLSSPIAGRGLMFSGYIAPVSVNVIDYVTIATAGNAVDFGDTDRLADWGSGYGNETRAIYAGGQGAPSNTISYVTIATQGNAADFGDLIGGNNSFNCGFAGDSVRGVLGGGLINGPESDTIQYVTMTSLGNAVDFGNLTQARQYGQAVTSPTRGCYGGGNGPAPAQYDIIDYVTIQSAGNAVDFGNLANARRIGSACSNSVRGVWSGEYSTASPYPMTAYMQYVNIASTGNSEEFGEAVIPTTAGPGMQCDSTRGLIVHGYAGTPSGPYGPAGYTKMISYINFATRGSTTEFGDRTTPGVGGACQASNTHGGIQ